jgi:transcriptional regulator with XRE-family HTH domain
LYVNDLARAHVPHNTDKSAKSRAAQFISRRIYELQARKSQAEIAAAAGFKSPGMISMITSGRVKLPIERAVALATALECDPAALVRLALVQSLSEQLLNQIFAPGAGAPSTNEQTILDRIRHLSANGDPELTKALDKSLVSVFRPTPPAPLGATYVTMVALSIEVRAALRDLANGKQFMTSALVRSERVGKRLETIKAELDQLIAALQGAYFAGDEFGD